MAAVSTLRDTDWATQYCTLCFEAAGIWPEGADGTDVNASARSYKRHLVASADDFGKVNLFRYPAYQPRVSCLSLGITRIACGAEIVVRSISVSMSRLRWSQQSRDQCSVRAGRHAAHLDGRQRHGHHPVGSVLRFVEWRGVCAQFGQSAALDSDAVRIELCRNCEQRTKMSYSNSALLSLSRRDSFSVRKCGFFISHLFYAFCERHGPRPRTFLVSDSKGMTQQLARRKDGEAVQRHGLLRGTRWLPVRPVLRHTACSLSCFVAATPGKQPARRCIWLCQAMSRKVWEDFQQSAELHSSCWVCVNFVWF